MTVWEYVYYYLLINKTHQFKELFEMNSVRAILCFIKGPRMLKNKLFHIHKFIKPHHCKLRHKISKLIHLNTQKQ